MNLRDFEYLLALEEHRNFNKAAQACFVTQPTLSAQIKKLEQFLGVELIERNPGNILITDAGKEVLKHAKVISSQVKQIKSAAKDFQNVYQSEVKLGLIPTVGPYLLPKIAKPLRKTLPDLKLQLFELQTHVLLERLQDGDIDAAILALPIEQNLDSLSVSRLYQEPFYLAVHHDHPLAKRKRLGLKDIQPLTFSVLEEGHCLREQVQELCGIHGAQINPLFIATSLETLRQMVAINEATTLMPALAIDQSEDSDVSYLPIQSSDLGRDIVMVMRKGTQKKVVFDAIVSMINDIVKL